VGTELIGDETDPAPRRSHQGALALAALLIVVAIAGVATWSSRRHHSAASASNVGPRATGLTFQDHWHVALGVDDCGAWVPSWRWLPGSDAQGGPARAGSHGRLYAGLHSHDDGIIHLEPLAADETGDRATLGLYFRYGGWKLGTGAITFVGVDRRNGDLCNGKPGVLRWAVNGKERHGDPAGYVLRNGDVVELVFITAAAPMPPQADVPSYQALQQILGR